MKTLLSFVFAASILTTLNAQAGQEGIGGGLCSYAQIACATNGDPMEDGATVVCLIGTDQARAFVTVEKDGNGETHTYDVTKIVHDPQQMGAGIDYAGQGLALHLVTDAPARPQGFYSTVSIENLGVRGKVLFCKIQK